MALQQQINRPTETMKLSYKSWHYLLDQRLASGREDVLLHVLLAMTVYTVPLRREAWELAAACGYEHHHRHSACLPMTECPATLWSAQAVNGNKGLANDSMMMIQKYTMVTKHLCGAECTYCANVVVTIKSLLTYLHFTYIHNSSKTYLS
jgi:hypothetical protein